MKKNNETKHFWGFPVTHFSYFFTWAIVFGYLTLWLEQEAGFNGVQAGLVFSMMSGISLIFQPIFGVISDRLVMKKTLIITIAVGMILVGPYFQWVFKPLLAMGPTTVAIITGIYMSFILNGGVSVVEQYVQRASLTNNFEFGHSRMGGSLAGATAALVGGRLFLWNPNSIFWACTTAAILLTCTLIFSDKINLDNLAAAGGEDTSNKLDLKQMSSIFKLRNFWILSLFYIGTSAVYDVFDQQFIIFFKSFFDNASQGTIAYSYMTSSQTALEFLLMIPMPWLINKIGSRNGLIIYGVILAIRILGSALVPNLTLIVIFRLLAGLEMPILLVSIMKYIAGAFDLRLYATVYALSSNFAKQLSVFFFSSFAGKMYDQVGFQHTYLILGIIVAVVTLICAFTLEKEDPIKAGQVKA
ncbi:oligosaccharide MFS transporter [Ligilactobacillus equi]|uniref:Raffinose permease n=1 Tax=Ligilactobacillus equi DSM 15833 = JCM 10991 TaxID=1423740 RepID=A0A0R1T471_9LACO|nr:oligosaccharide MFS transporter [Ligilactobacillus equi]KRL76231.1 raffinose permease [Ligilactobacillus equi DSM 15833 = JCM 10991]